MADAWDGFVSVPEEVLRCGAVRGLQIQHEDGREGYVAVWAHNKRTLERALAFAKAALIIALSGEEGPQIQALVQEHGFDQSQCLVFLAMVNGMRSWWPR